MVDAVSVTDLFPPAMSSSVAVNVTVLELCVWPDGIVSVVPDHMNASEVAGPTVTVTASVATAASVARTVVALSAPLSAIVDEPNASPICGTSLSRIVRVAEVIVGVTSPWLYQ